MPYLFSQEPFPVSKLCIFRSCFTLSFQPMCFWGDKGLLTVTSRLANCCSLRNSQKSRNFPPVRAFQYAEDRLPRDQLLLLSSSLSCSLFTPVFLDPIYPSVSLFPSLCCFPQYFFLCFFSVLGLSLTEVFHYTQKVTALLYFSVATALFWAFPVLLHLRSLALWDRGFLPFCICTIPVRVGPAFTLMQLVQINDSLALRFLNQGGTVYIFPAIIPFFLKN